MDEKRDGPGGVPTRERMRDIGSAIVSSMAQKASGDQDRSAWTFELGLRPWVERF